MDLKDKVKAIREATSSSIAVGDKSYKVNSDVVTMLDGEGVCYLDGEERKGKDGGSIFVTYTKTLKKSDADFEERFASIYDTIAGEMLLKDGIDVEGVNPLLKKP
jgi:hypothetical protein